MKLNDYWPEDKTSGNLCMKIGIDGGCKLLKFVRCNLVYSTRSGLCGAWLLQGR